MALFCCHTHIIDFARHDYTRVVKRKNCVLLLLLHQLRDFQGSSSRILCEINDRSSELYYARTSRDPILDVYRITTVHW